MRAINRYNVWQKVRETLYIVAAIVTIASASLMLWQAHRTVAAFFGGLAVASLVCYVIWLLWLPPPPPPPESVEEHDVETFGRDQSEVTISVRLVTRASSKGALELDLDLFMSFAERLSTYLGSVKRAQIVACIGVNSGGFVLANHVARNYWRGISSDRLGLLLTDRIPSGVLPRDLPAKDPPGVLPRRGKSFPSAGYLLVVDSQLKTGKSLGKVCRYLQHKDVYGCKNGQIWYLAGVACGIGGDEIAAVRQDMQGRVYLKELLGKSTVGSELTTRKFAAKNVLCVACVTPKGAVALPGEFF